MPQNVNGSRTSLTKERLHLLETSALNENPFSGLNWSKDSAAHDITKAAVTKTKIACQGERDFRVKKHADVDKPISRIGRTTQRPSGCQADTSPRLATTPATAPT